MDRDEKVVGFFFAGGFVVLFGVWGYFFFFNLKHDLETDECLTS